MLLGLRTIIYPVTDLTKAIGWYTDIIGHAPYFNEPFYVGFNVGGYELGLMPAGDEDVAHGPATYWGTSDIVMTQAHLLSHGARAQNDIKDVGDGIKVASVIDPFGNVIGIIENPHFKADGVEK
jgi:predicted enzyme related to lactoylglutathione lyase